MHISTQVEAPLATALLLASFALFVLSRRAVQKSRLHQTLDLAVSAPNLVLLAVHMGLSWSKTCENGREVMIGVSSLFPFLLVLQILIVTVWMIASFFAVQNAGASVGERLTFATSEATNKSTAHTIKDFIGGLSQDCYRRAFNCQEVSPAAPGQV
ncbi:hypothetical protein MYU51_019541 [Penicillium brevicompactum]